MPYINCSHERMYQFIIIVCKLLCSSGVCLKNVDRCRTNKTRGDDANNHLIMIKLCHRGIKIEDTRRTYRERIFAIMNLNMGTWLSCQIINSEKKGEKKITAIIKTF